MYSLSLLETSCLKLSNKLEDIKIAHLILVMRQIFSKANDVGKQVSEETHFPIIEP